jgi:hypothetical protein
MFTFKQRQTFTPEDLELIERVYSVALAYIEARDLYRDTAQDVEEEAALRRLMFASAGDTRLDFDMLCDTVLARIDNYRAWYRTAA